MSAHSRVNDQGQKRGQQTKASCCQNALVVWNQYYAGNADIYAAPEPRVRHFYPSIVETPSLAPALKYEFGKLEDLMWRGRRGATPPPTRVLAEANDR